MIRSTYIRYELLRTFRNWRFVMSSLAFPAILYFAIVGPQRHAIASTVSPSPCTSWRVWLRWAR